MLAAGGASVLQRSAEGASAQQGDQAGCAQATPPRNPTARVCGGAGFTRRDVSGARQARRTHSSDRAGVRRTGQCPCFGASSDQRRRQSWWQLGMRSQIAGRSREPSRSPQSA
eukprot:5348458-Prymnesium_polylepis.1